MPTQHRPVHHSSVRVLAWIALSGCAVAAVLWLAQPSLGRWLARVYAGVDDAAVRIEANGRVVDAAGVPVEGAQVRGAWQVFVPGDDAPRASGTFDERTRADGRYLHIAAFTSDLLEAAERLEVRLSMRAHGPFEGCEPSPPKEWTLPARDVVTGDFRLGAPRPTVPVRVVDAAAQPVTEFWVSALPAEAASVGGDDVRWPHRFKDFPDGVAELPVPPRRFRVEVHLHGGARAAVVGPFDPAALPARIDVVLPDR